MYLPLKNLNPHECYLYFVSGHLYSWKAASLTSFLQKRVNVNVGQHFLLGKRKKKQNKTTLFAAYNIHNLTVLNSSPYHITSWEYKETDMLTVHILRHFRVCWFSHHSFLDKTTKGWISTDTKDGLYLHLPTHVYMLWKVTAVLSPHLGSTIGRENNLQAGTGGREEGDGQKLLHLAPGRRQDASVCGAEGARHESGSRQEK